MNEKHNIDRLFREKFKDFEVAPPEFVWENIEEALREKKKRRVVPLWVRLSGVAAILVIGSIFSISYFGSTDVNSNPVVIDKDGPKRIYPTEHPIPNNGIIIGDSTRVNAGGNSAVASGDENLGNNGGAASGNDPTKGANYNGSNSAFNNTTNVVAHDGKANPTLKDNDSNSRHGGKKVRNAVPGHTTQAVANAPAERDWPGRNAANSRPDGSNSNNNPRDTGTPAKNLDAIAAGREKRPVQQQGSQDASVPNKDAQNTGLITNEVPKEQAIAEAAVDTASVAEPENPLEKLLKDKLNGDKDKEEGVAENSDKGKWNIKPQVAPVFYNSLSEGSPIDGQFAGNDKNFDNDLSYGVGIDYALNDRLSVRSGVNTVNLSYATNGIQFRPSLTGATNNVSARSKAAHILVQNADAPGTGATPAAPDGFIALSGFSNEQTFNGAMVQKTGYIEVPVELSYSIVKSKFGVDLIGGVSTLFLNENNVSVVSNQGYSAQVGEAQNLNNIHFSTNVGLGFKYRFWKSFQANFEPMFKYQVNAYSRDAGNFKPYFIGLYSGISFSF